MRPIPGPNEPLLHDSEKLQLRELLQPGAALHKIVRETVDYSDKLGQYILSLDLSDPDQAKLAGQLQRRRAAGLDFVKWFVQVISDPSQQATHMKEFSNG